MAANGDDVTITVGGAHRARRLVAVLVVFLCGAAGVAGSAAAADATWSGADTTTPGPNWSDPANWSGHVAPASAATVGTLSFPPLTTSDCTSPTPVGTCYQSNNDLTGVTVGRLAITGTGYNVTGNAITLNGGLTSTGSAVLSLPIMLSAAQTWDLGSDLRLGSPLSGDQPLTVNNSSQLTVNGDNELGAVSITGGGLTVHGDLNSVDGNAVTLTRVGAGFPAGPASVGALSSVGSNIVLGQPGAGGADASLSTTSARFDSASSLFLLLGEELTSTGPVNLGGASIAVEVQHNFCDPSPLGTVTTLVSSTGALTGTFGNAPEGGTIVGSCADKYRINYHRTGAAKTVTATFAGAPTTTSLAAVPNAAVTNQTVTLSATVSTQEPPGSLIGGTVAFERSGRTIAGCGAVSVTFTNPVYVASCPISFAAASSPVALRAVFTPATGSHDLSSTGTASLLVRKDATNTTLAVSRPSPAVGARETYRATVTGAHSGSTKPSGRVEFLDHGRTISSCARRRLKTRGGALVATCRLRYRVAGSHSITATYLGDQNFTESTSAPPQTVTVR